MRMVLRSKIDPTKIYFRTPLSLLRCTFVLIGTGDRVTRSKLGAQLLSLAIVRNIF
jgi:hypothetical protein